MTEKSVLIMAAGTGGHIFPALAVAEKLQQKGFRIDWLGTPSGMENRVLGDTSIKVHQLPVNGLRGKGKLALLKAPFMLFRSLLAAIAVVREVKPCCVLGMGGYVSGPGGVAAWLLGCPLLLHEQNAVAGTTNRLLAPFAKQIMTTYPDTFSGKNKGKATVTQTGNPVRSGIKRQLQSTNQEPTDTTILPIKVLVIGGSQGAAAINQAVAEMACRVSAENMTIWHQAGRGKVQSVQEVLAEAGVEEGSVRVVEFIDDMPAAYAWADIVICRAGAGTLAEITVAGLPSVLIPYPYATDDHQRVNAEQLQKAGAAEMLLQSELSSEVLQSVMETLMKDAGKRLSMAEAARSAAFPDAAENVAQACEEYCNGR